MRLQYKRSFIILVMSMSFSGGEGGMGERVKQVEVVVFPDGRLDTKNASAYLGLSEKTLAMMRCQGTGPRFIKRGRIFYYQEDLDAWLAQAKRVTSTAQIKHHMA
jgi:hypothetical protein